MNSSPRTQPCIGIDVGGTKCLGIVWHAGEIVRQVRYATPRGAQAIIEVLCAIVHELESGSPTHGVGVGVPGLVTRAGILRAAPNLLDIADFAVGPMLQASLGRPVWVDNDATCATVAEWKFGAAGDCTDAVVVTLGTGIGGGIVSNGYLLRGTNGFAGEMGHMVVDPEGPICPCGHRGCWERYASGNGLAYLAQQAAQGGQLRTVLDFAGTVQDIRGEHVLSLALSGDPLALELVDQFARWVALGLVNLTNILDPQVIVIGGGLVISGDLFLGPIRRWFSELLYSPALRPHPEIRLANFGEMAGAVGAAMLPLGHT